MTTEIKESFEGKSVEELLGSISEKEWEEAGWPVVSHTSKVLFASFNSNSDYTEDFWKEVLKPENYVTPNGNSGYDSEKDFLFVLHSFKNDDGEESIIKVITTTKEMLEKYSAYVINYKFHGIPCEGKTGGSYPSCDFWKDFYDNLTDEEMDKYPIPTMEWRKKFVLREYFKKD